MSRQKVEERVSRALSVLSVMERILHGREQWFVRLDQDVYPGWVVCEEFLGVRVKPHIPAPKRIAPVLLCEQDEIMYHNEINFPASVVYFTWWFTGISATK